MTVTNHNCNTWAEVVDDLTYRNYVHNRQISPHISVERWTKAYGPNTAAMEERFQRDQDLYRRIDQCREADANCYSDPYAGVEQ
jgi:hypothetical protein